ncbi:hypothetical protein [Phenylobacterium sp.]|jgi:hypothetical protein|uniref:hypothetical protein n=1 Tax=Phenylobacterium sp. TaxID=1871053 RepID=UPI002E2EC855|nr:hypothetical protein [Phenylobacterium sp.]HEX2560877.1 hypothetical protein [Phenylobacterium sp.]
MTNPTPSEQDQTKQGVQPKPKIEENNTLGRGADTRKTDENNQHSGGASGTGGVGGTGGSVL